MSELDAMIIESKRKYHLTDLASNMDESLNHGLIENLTADERLLLGTLGGRLQLARTRCRKSQEALGLACGASQATIARMETGVTPNVNGEILFPLADALGVDPRWLCTGQGSMVTSDANESVRVAHNAIEQAALCLRVCQQTQGSDKDKLIILAMDLLQQVPVVK